MTKTHFGRRGLVGAPTLGRTPPAPAPRRLRSGVVIVGMVGAATFGGVALAEWRNERCPPRDPLHPENRPSWCDVRGGRSHSYGGSHGFFSGGGGGSGFGVGHASFGGFGHSASGHGSGS